MCDYVPGELLIGFHRDDSAAALLVQQIEGGQIEHVTVLDSLENRLARLGLSQRTGLTFRFFKLGVPSGDETFKISYLQFYYKIALLEVLSEGRFTPDKNPVHQEILGRSNFHPQIVQNGILSVAATASAAPRTAFTFNSTHTAYRQAFGWPGTTSNGSGMKILVMDTGVDSLPAYNIVDGRNFIDDTQKQDVSDEHGHGTAMASILHDIAPGADVIVYKVADSAGISSEWTLLGGMGAISDANIINLSLEFGLGDLKCPQCGRVSHSTRSGLFENMIDDLMKLPDAPLIVGAAGNAGNAELSFPARYSNVVAIESVDGALNLSRFSNRSTTDHVGQAHQYVFVLPGGRGVPQGIPSEYIGASASGAQHHGTSVAAAYASGIIARVWSDPQRRQWNRHQVLTYLCSNASKTSLPNYVATTHGNGLMRCV
jgi:subtilisin family serine protease